MDTKRLSLTFDVLSNRRLDFHLPSFADEEKSHALTHPTHYNILISSTMFNKIGCFDRTKLSFYSSELLTCGGDSKLFSYFRSVQQLTANDKITADRIFDLKHRIYDQKKFSWIYMNSTSANIYNTYQSLIRRYKVLIYFLSLFSRC